MKKVIAVCGLFFMDNKKLNGGRIAIVISIFLIGFLLNVDGEAIAGSNDESVNAFVATDLGHGSGCVHNHNSSCYHSHSLYSCGARHVWSSGRTLWSTCTYCGGTVCEAIGCYCELCWAQFPGTPLRCAGVCRREVLWQEHALGLGAGPCSKSGNWLCGLSTSSLICSVSAYGNCVMPSTNVTRSVSGWTNKDVSCTGQFPTFTFTDGNPKQVVFTSVTGHRIQETVVSNVDKIAPEVSEYVIK